MYAGSIKEGGGAFLTEKERRTEKKIENILFTHNR